MGVISRKIRVKKMKNKNKTKVTGAGSSKNIIRINLGKGGGGPSYMPSAPVLIQQPYQQQPQQQDNTMQLLKFIYDQQNVNNNKLNPLDPRNGEVADRIAARTAYERAEKAFIRELPVDAPLTFATPSTIGKGEDTLPFREGVYASPPQPPRDSPPNLLPSGFRPPLAYNEELKSLLSPDGSRSAFLKPTPKIVKINDIGPPVTPAEQLKALVATGATISPSQIKMLNGSRQTTPLPVLGESPNLAEIPVSNSPNIAERPIDRESPNIPKPPPQPPVVSKQPAEKRPPGRPPGSKNKEKPKPAPGSAEEGAITRSRSNTPAGAAMEN